MVYFLGENYDIPVNTPSLSTCSTSLYNFFEEDEKECQKDLDEILRTQAFGGDEEDDGGDGGGNGGDVMFFPTVMPTKATCLEYAVKSKPQLNEEDDGDEDDEEDGGDQEENSEEENKNEEMSKIKRYIIIFNCFREVN